MAKKNTVSTEETSTVAVEQAAPPTSEPPSDAPEDMGTIKDRWLNRRATIERARAALRALEADHEVDSEAIATAAIKAAKSMSVQAIVMVGPYRMAAKRRPERSGGGVQLVDAPIATAIDI